MANLKTIRKRISSVKATQKITRAMKMVAGARLNRAQMRITALRPYAIKVSEVLESVSAAALGDKMTDKPGLGRTPPRVFIRSSAAAPRSTCSSSPCPAIAACAARSTPT